MSPSTSASSATPGGAHLTYLTGGARSGKSSLAVRRAGAYDGPVVLLATAEVVDEEMATRIARHRAERPAHWSTLEEPRAVVEAVARVAADALLVVDCLSLWVSTLVADGLDEGACAELGDRLGAALVTRTAPSLVVTNEVGLGLVPMHPVGRAYRDALGRTNAAVAAHADLAQLVVSGRTLTLDPPEPDHPTDPLDAGGQP